ncbi:heavy-metal-associated domain-containing protein [Leifsonia sp. F6_8S_P_1B]|uniref:Heavy-metal-associated domain-containing protein n=1 Tax=Leifsonia williamsii TaxID=3035919 RepID=A0ABT8KD95_9MICO|nr:heavy-metal-associated domain-containing protein [Leifsonia williamsii]MDN4614746.1 heavy-metal-associated domain-containing protein [Leifsonia williamsii]
MQTTYDILGMTCDHCARAVTEELTAIDGVAGVTVDVAAGTATVDSAVPLAEPDVRAAVEEAGYTLARADRLPLL